jgi:ArsR family transcriptional regulator
VIILAQIDKKQFKTRIIQLLGKCENIHNAEEYYGSLKSLSTGLKSEKGFIFLKGIFEVLGNTDRLLIINALREKDRCSCELEALLQKSQPAISRDLRILEDARLIQGWKKGKFIHYSLIKSTFAQLNGFLNEWLESLENWFESLHEV